MNVCSCHDVFYGTYAHIAKEVVEKKAGGPTMQDLFMETKVLIGIKDANKLIRIILRSVHLEEAETSNLLHDLIFKEGIADTSESKIGFIHH